MNPKDNLFSEVVIGSLQNDPMALQDEAYLIIGNGFDIDLGLPTRYPDYIHFLQCVEKLNTGESIKDNQHLHPQIRSMLDGSKPGEYWKKLR